MKSVGVSISDAGSKLVALAQVVSMIETFEQGQMEEIEATFGSDASAIIDRLRNLTVADSWQLAQMKQLQICIGVDSSSLKLCFVNLDAARRELVLFEYFCRHQASARLLAQLFKRSAEQIKSSRRCFNSHYKGGRPRLPNLPTRDAICVAWVQLGKSSNDARQRYYELHQRFPQFNFLQLEAVIDEYNTM